MANETETDKPKRKSLRTLADVEVTQTGASASELRDEALERVDREAIDNIVLSTDVQSGGKIRVTRKGPYDRDFQWVCNIPAEQWKTDTTFEWLKTMYGGGDYECKTFRANGQMYKPFSFSIDHRYKGKLDEDEIKRLATEQGGKSNGASDMIRIFEMMRADKPKDDGLKSHDLLKIMEMSSQKSDQMMMLMMTMMNKSSETMMQMMTAMIAANSGNKGSSLDPVIVELLKTKTEKTPLVEVLESMKMIKELSAPEKEEKEPEKPFWEKLAMAALPMVAGSLGGQPAPVPQPPAPSQPSQPSSGELTPETMNMLNNVMVRMFLNKVLVAASQGADPTLYADMIIEMLPEDKLKMLRDVLTQADWAVKLFGEDQRVQASMVWLTELKNQILSDGVSSESSSPAGSGPTVPPA